MPHHIDAHVGSRLRTLRKMRGMSQEELARQLGVSFQQVQKYEKGINRIGSSRLYQIAQLCGISVQYFFEGMPRSESGADAPEHVEDLDSFWNSQGRRLALAYSRLADPSVRRSVLRLVEALGAGRE